MNMRLFCNSFADWCRLAKIHWTLMNKIKGPQLFSLYATNVWEELDINLTTHTLTNSQHKFTRNCTGRIISLVKDNPQGCSSIQSSVRMNLWFINRQGSKKLSFPAHCNQTWHLIYHLMSVSKWLEVTTKIDFSISKHPYSINYIRINNINNFFYQILIWQVWFICYYYYY